MNHGYNWKAIVAENKPGSGTDDQRSRAQLLPRVASDLHDWAVRHDLWVQRVPPSAYTGVVSTRVSPEHPREAALVARYVLWIFSLDDHLDRAHLAGDAGAADAFEDHLAHSIKPLYDVAGLTQAQAAECGLGWAIGRGCQATRKTASLRDALADICRELAAAARSVEAGDGPGPFALTSFARELARMIAAAREELRESSAARRRQTDLVLPSLESYLRRGAISISFPCIATVPCCFEPDPRAAWEACESAIQSGGAIARLCNDLAGYETEVAEMRVNAMTLAFAQLGFEPFAARDLNSPEVALARELVTKRLEEELALFSRISADLPDGRLSYWVRTMPAFAIAMYEKGNYIAPA
jgi:hypothetical protein